MPLAPNSAMLMLPPSMQGGIPELKLPTGQRVAKPHPEWYLHQLRWRWLLDSWEGGEAYRMAVYGFDVRGLPIRNLIRHKREYPTSDSETYSVQTGRPPGTDQYNQATDDDYELRRARTPVPGFLAEVVETHLSKIYGKEVLRDGPDAITEWWEDVDGKGTTADQWMSETIAPLLLVLGQLDVMMDHPPAPKGEDVVSEADVDRLGLDRVVASHVLPENMIWWVLDHKGHYTECIIREVQDDLDVNWRYWNRDVWCTYNKLGKMLVKPVRHRFGRVPIVRLFDRRRPRSKNVGLPRYEIVAELMREYYNKTSELVLSDTQHAHPLLQGPEEYCTPDGTVAIGPGYLMPKKKTVNGSGATYEGFDVIEFPHAGADSIRINAYDLRDSVDRQAALTKPAGAAGTDGNTVSQSGISKRLDATTGNDLLGKISTMLGRNEKTITDLFWFVLGDGKPDDADEDATTVQYPTEFDLMSGTELAALIDKYQIVVSTAGNSPEVEKRMLIRLMRQMLGGMSDEDYKVMEAEIEGIVNRPPLTGPGSPQPEPEDGEFGQDGEPKATGVPNDKAMNANMLNDAVNRNPDDLVG